MNKSFILNKIKEHYGFKKDSELAKLLDISPQTFSNWKKRNSYDPQLIYNKCPAINPEWLLTGKGSMTKKVSVNKKYSLSVLEDSPLTFVTEKVQNLPLYDLDINGGLKNVLQKNSAHSMVSNFIKIPNLAECDGAGYIKGNSMLPLFKNGDIVIYKGITTDSIFWGELYLIEVGLPDNSNFITVRHIQKSELGNEYIKLVSENPMYEPKDVPLTTVNAIAIIRASIQFH